MSLRLLSIFLILSSLSFAQIDLKVTYEKADNGINIYTENGEYCPVSLRLKLKLQNMKTVEPIKDLYIIESRTPKQFLVRLEPIDATKGYKYSYNTQYQLGNHLFEAYDADYAYSLPYEKGKTHKIYQGYNGKMSHQKIYALDFDLKEGSPIVAMRDGVVIKVVDHNTRHCAEERCKKYNNKIIVYHSDGTFAEYTHLKKDGAMVKVGDKIKQDQVIGKSGNTGWSSGPHLHIIVYLQRMTYRESLATKFKIGDGSQTAILREGESYTKDY